MGSDSKEKEKYITNHSKMRYSGIIDNFIYPDILMLQLLLKYFPQFLELSEKWVDKLIKS